MFQSIPILTFHALDDQPSVISFHPNLFAHAMNHLHDCGYQTLNLTESLSYLQRGLPFPERSFVITFDDGYQSVYEKALPILQRHSFSATIFLTTGEKSKFTDKGRLPSMSGRPMLSWREIKETHRSGFEMGAHTLTHPDLTRLPLNRIEIEVCDSKAIIEDALGSPVATFAYPFGRYDNRCLELVGRHFVCACSDKLGLIDLRSDPYAFERVDAYYLHSRRLLNCLPSRLFPWYVRGRALPRQMRRSYEKIFYG